MTIIGFATRGLFASFLCLLIAVNGFTGPAYAQAEAPSFRIVDTEWMDDMRARNVPVRLYWPSDITPDMRIPLVVFSHGIGGSRQGYSYLGRYWAARGIASLHVQHVGSDSSLWAANPLTLVQRLQLAAHESEALARAADVRFALDRMLSPETGSYSTVIDRHRIIVAGHSYGANTALVSVGAGVMRRGGWVDAKDPRFAAAIVISSPPFYGETDLAAVLKNVTVPTLHVTTTDDVIRIPGYYSPATDRIGVYNAVAGPRKMIAVFQGGSHNSFTDRTSSRGQNLNAYVKTATAELTLAFMDVIFRGNQFEMMRWKTKWQAIVALPPDVAAIQRPLAEEASANRKTRASVKALQ